MGILGNFSTEEFLADYWQKKTLFLPRVYRKPISDLSFETIARYAINDAIESRLISYNRSTDKWNCKFGPFDGADLASLPMEDWTLLLQSLDYFHPQLGDLIADCSFLPQWRLDDVMVSYSTNNGSVGPHVDKYDVFLVQGFGKKEWLIGETGRHYKATQPHPDLNQIELFDVKHEFTAQPGDVLYIPANTPHWGTAKSNCLTYSVGFRAPSSAQFLSYYLEEIAAVEAHDKLFSDAGKITRKDKDGRMPENLVAWGERAVNASLHNRQAMTRATGRLVTDLKYPEFLDDIDAPSISKLQDYLGGYGGLMRRNYARTMYHRQPDGSLLLFVNGEMLELEEKWEYLVRLLCRERIFASAALSQWLHDADFYPLIQELFAAGLFENLPGCN